MRSGKEILLASKEFAGENWLRSWLEILGTVLLTAIFFIGSVVITPIIFRIAFVLSTSLLYVRLLICNLPRLSASGHFAKLNYRKHSNANHWNLFVGTSNHLETFTRTSP